MTREQINSGPMAIHQNLRQEILSDATLAHRQQQMCQQQTIPKTIHQSSHQNRNESPTKQSQNLDDDQSLQSTIAILRRNPMYDSLVLVKRFRPKLNGFALEFPSSNNNSAVIQTEPKETTALRSRCQKRETKTRSNGCKSKLRSVYLDSDDPIYLSMDSNGSSILCQDGELVYVPMNGLIERLDKFEQLGLMIDSKVYAFAMGIKTAEKFLTTNSVKELQETPQL